MTINMIAVVAIVLAVIGILIDRKTRSKVKSVEDNRLEDAVIAKKIYQYRRKEYIMSKRENDFYDVLVQAVGNSYYVFPQIHLASFLDHRVNGQPWNYALWSINQKSVDYTICDKASRKLLLAIELDDWSHEAENRKERDADVEHILQDTGIQLLRFKNIQGLSANEIRQRIQAKLATS